MVEKAKNTGEATLVFLRVAQEVYGNPPAQNDAAEAQTPQAAQVVEQGQVLTFVVEFSLTRPVSGLEYSIQIYELGGRLAFATTNTELGTPLGALQAGTHEVRCLVAAALPAGEYTASFAFAELVNAGSDAGALHLAALEDACSFRVQIPKNLHSRGYLTLHCCILHYQKNANVNFKSVADSGLEKFIENKKILLDGFFRDPEFFYEWDFKSKNLDISVEGLSAFEVWGCWSDGENVNFKVPEKVFGGREYIIFYVIPYLPRDSDKKYLDVIVDAGFYLRSLRIGYSQNGSSVMIKIPFKKLVFDDFGFCSIKFFINNPSAPSEFGAHDSRRLGLGFHRLAIDDFDLESLYDKNYNKIIDKEKSFLGVDFVLHNFDDRFSIEAYRLVFFVQKIMTSFGVDFYFSCGTLLGAARHKGLIPWDDDLDLCMLKKHVEIFESRIIPEFESLGLEVTKNPDPKHWLGYNIVLKNREIRDFLTPYCDIFIVDIVDGRIVDEKNNLRAKPLFEDVFPTKTMNFGGLDISVPKNHEAVLFQDFGDQWNTSVKKYNHMYKQFELKEEDPEENFLPAGPFIRVSGE